MFHSNPSDAMQRNYGYCQLKLFKLNTGFKPFYVTVYNPGIKGLNI